MKGPCVTAPSDDTYGGSCASIRMDALLDAMTRVKVDDLAARFHRPRAAVLRQIMHWGLRHGRTTPSDENASPGSVRHLYLNVDAVLQEQVATAAAVTGGTNRGVGPPDSVPDHPDGFPCELAGGPRGGRSHNSHRYGTRFMLRLDAPSEPTGLGCRPRSRAVPTSVKPPKNSRRLHRAACEALIETSTLIKTVRNGTSTRV